ncbi:tryptophanase [Mycobacterium sp. E342]|uniref:tryptophanase n=1 Tax=Mycobacterium sp. E342 TaxID=1834147 RepID=UPI000B2C8FB5|nr:tryptophanase [Mycobacterium sp. E342]
MLTGLEEKRSWPLMTLNLASRCSPAQSRPTTDSAHISDEDMAWSLVDAVKSCLTDYERTVVFVELGCGEGYLVIKRIITVLLVTRMTLPEAILWKLSRWLNGYAGSPEEPQLRMMLDVIRLQQLEAGSRDD